jgi:hypothetical protein
MIHPVFHLIATQPQLLADHVEAYAELVADELRSTSTVWKWRVLLNAVALCCMGVAVVLAGVALMLWAVIPPADIHAPWALVAGPLIPLAAAALCLLIARSQVRRSGFDSIREQFSADVAMLREAGAA